MFKGKLVVGGDFDSGYTGTGYSRLNGIGRWSDPVGIPSTEQGQEFDIYPNPTPSAGIITLRNNTEAKHFRLYDITGKLVYNKSIDAGNKVQLPQLAAGIYIAELSGDSVKLTQRLSVE